MAGVLVSAATGAMGSLLGKLATMLGDQYKLFKGVRRDIEFLKKELEAMHAFLLRIADVEEPDEQAKLRVDAVRNLSYDIEDSIDDFMLLADRESDPDAHGLEDLFRRCKKKIKDVQIRHKIAKEVKDIMSQVNEVSERYARYQIGESSTKPKNAKVDPRVVAVFKDISELVGIDGPRDELVKWLSMNSAEPAHQRKVVSIVGYGGLGKTTLANQVYHNMGSSFDCRAFVSISRDPDITKILSSILSQISKGDVRAEVGDQQLIIGQIREFLKDKRTATRSHFAPLHPVPTTSIDQIGSRRQVAEPRCGISNSRRCCEASGSGFTARHGAAIPAGWGIEQRSRLRRSTREFAVDELLRENRYE